MENVILIVHLILALCLIGVVLLQRSVLAWAAAAAVAGWSALAELRRRLAR